MAKKVYSNLELIGEQADQIMFNRSMMRVRELFEKGVTWEQMRERITSHDLARAVIFLLEKERQLEAERQANTIIIEDADFQLLN